MTEHDRTRKERALKAIRDSKNNAFSSYEEEMEALYHAVAGMQSTDDPSLVPLCDEVMELYTKRKGEKK